MNLPAVKQFFNNKVTIRLKSGHRFEGLLSQVNYKNQTLVLQDVQDLGNQTDKNFIPHDKKILEKAFQCDNIEQILFKEKHFCEAKKYNKDQFWDAVSQPVVQQSKYKEKSYGDRTDKPYYKKNYYDNRDNRGGENRGQYRGGENRGEYRGGDNRSEYRGGDNRRRQGGNYNNRGGNNYRNYNDKERTTDNRRREEPKEEQANDRDYR